MVILKDYSEIVFKNIVVSNSQETGVKHTNTDIVPSIKAWLLNEDYLYLYFLLIIIIIIKLKMKLLATSVRLDLLKYATDLNKFSPNITELFPGVKYELKATFSPIR